jgi:hypothetical protein
MMKKTLLICLFLYAGIIHAQNKYSITGYVKDSLSSENLIGATVSFIGQHKGVNTNACFEFFSDIFEFLVAITASLNTSSFNALWRCR